MRTDLSRKIRLCVAVLILALTALVLSPIVGMKWIGLHAWFDVLAESLDATIFWRIRLPRAALAFLAGAALALSGMVFQAMFRNPLATPFTLGVSSGASLGATLYLHLGIVFSVAGMPGLLCFAFLGALGSISLVYGLTRRHSLLSSATMLLAGVGVSLFFSSLILFLQYVSDVHRSFRILRWLMGGLETVGWDAVRTLCPFVLLGSLLILALAPELNLLCLGDELAAGRGLALRRTRRLLFFATSLMVAAVVSVCGPIGFIGMIVPHLCRLVIGPEHRFLSLFTLAGGGTFLLLCDTLARTLIAPAEIPVGVITALLGGPFFLWLLLRAGADGRMFP